MTAQEFVEQVRAKHADLCAKRIGVSQPTISWLNEEFIEDIAFLLQEYQETNNNQQLKTYNYDTQRSKNDTASNAV